MSHRIAPVTLESAPDGARTALTGLKNALGFVPNIYATTAHSPAALGGYLSFSAALGKGSLSAREAELLSLHVSELNGCGYCLSAHGALSKRQDFTADDIDRARRGIGKNAREDALLALAGRIVRTGGRGAGAELERARAAGVTDAEVVEVIGHVASKAFTNALAIVAKTPIDFPEQPNLPSD